MKHIFWPKMAPADDNGGSDGGTTDPNKNDNGSGGGNEPSEVDQLKEQLDQERKAKKQLSDQVTKLSEDFKTLQRQAHKGKEDYKTLAEGLEKENGELKSTLQKFKDAVHHTARVGEVKAAALKAGLREEAVADLEGMDLSEVEVEIDASNVIRVKGADDYAAKLKKLKGYMFKAPADPNFNAGNGGGNGNSGGGGEKVTREQWQKAFLNRNKSTEARAEYNKVNKLYNEQTKKQA